MRSSLPASSLPPRAPRTSLRDADAALAEAFGTSDVLVPPPPEEGAIPEWHLATGVKPLRPLPHDLAETVRHRRSAPKIGTPRLRPALQLLAALTTGATSDSKRTLRASNAKRATFGCLPLHAKAQRVTTKTSTAPPRERSTAGDGGAALCARTPRATEKFPKGDYSYTRILAGGNSVEFQGARLDTATRARARHTRAPRSLCAFALVATCTGRPTA